MPFITLPEFDGKLYVPQNDPECLRKHDCRNCFSCQMCSDDRCALCINSEACCQKTEDQPDPRY